MKITKREMVLTQAKSEDLLALPVSVGASPKQIRLVERVLLKRATLPEPAEMYFTGTPGNPTGVHTGQEYLTAVYNTGERLKVTAWYADSWDKRDEWIPLDDLYIDPNYQRGEKSFARLLAANLNPHAMMQPLVALRNGAYYVVDGQQRVRALISRRDEGIETPGNGKIQCTVFPSTGQRYEAKIFRIANNRVNVSALENYAAGLIQGDALCVNIDSTVRECGFHVGGSGCWPQIKCVKKLETIVGQRGCEMLQRILGLIFECWNGESDGLHTAIIGGLFQFFSEASDAGEARGFKLDIRHLERRLKQKRPANLLADGAMYSTAFSGARDSGVCHSLKLIYNKGKRNDGLRFPMKVMKDSQ